MTPPDQTPANVTEIDFKKIRRRYEFLGSGTYKDLKTGRYCWRPYRDGRQTFIVLRATNKRYAQMEAANNYRELALSKKGLAPDPLAKGYTIGDLCRLYVEAGCPRKKHMAVRTGTQLRNEQRRAGIIAKWPLSKRQGGRMRLEDCLEYREWRAKSIKGHGNPSRTGDRQIDTELVTLSNVYRWAMRHSTKTGITANPIGQERPQFRDPSQVKHCRESQPESAEELHAIASRFFEHPRSEVLGWQVLLEAMIGQRTHELIHLRYDAKPGAPGYIQDMDRDRVNQTDRHFLKSFQAPNTPTVKILHLYRSTSSKGTYGHIPLLAPLEACLSALRTWHERRYPRSPWYLPSPENPARPIGRDSLTHGLYRITPTLRIGHRTSHGLRSFYVNVLRQRLGDAEVALRIGQTTNGKLIASTYGEIYPHQLNWLPKNLPPAWVRWAPGEAGAKVWVQGELL